MIFAMNRWGGVIVEKLGKINNQNGAALVEFAIVLPVLLMLIFEMIEFSLLLYDKAMITNASREGARAGSFIHFQRLYPRLKLPRLDNSFKPI